MARSGRVGPSEHHGRDRCMMMGFARSKMAQRWVILMVASSCFVSLSVVASEPALVRPNESFSRLGVRGASGESEPRRTLDTGEGAEIRTEENIVLRQGIVFQTEGCPQVISEEEALARAKNESLPGNIISLGSEGAGRAGNHFLVISDFFAMAYCCKTKVLRMPRHDHSFPPAVSGNGSQFETENHFFDFSGVDTMPLEEYQGLSKNPLVCKPHFDLGGRSAIYLQSIHDDLLSCMNRVYVRGCEAAYLQPILGAERFSYCSKPAANNGRRLSDESKRQDGMPGTTMTTPSFIDAASFPASEEIKAGVGTADPGARAPGSASSVRASSKMGQYNPLSDNRDLESLQDSRAGDTAMGVDGNSKSRSDGEPSTDAQESSADKGSLDGRRRMREAGANEGELSVGGGSMPGMTRSQVHDDRDDFQSKSISGIAKRGSAGSLVIHIRSGDIFRFVGPDRTPSRGFLSYGQPPLQFYLRAIASQPWSDVTILTSCSRPQQLNPTFAALEMLQQTGVLGPNVATHKDRDLLTDIRSMLCADGLAISRSTLHFLTFAHTRAKHLYVPSECGPGFYARGLRDDRDGDKETIKKKPVPNNTTLLCIENSDTKVYGVEWKVNEAAYFLYDNWDASPAQRQDMVLFNGVQGLSHCCAA